MSPTEDLTTEQDSQWNPGRAIGEISDQRGIAAHHYFSTETIEAIVFDAAAQTWEAPVQLRDTGEWDSEEYTRLEVRPTTTGGVLFEDANGQLFAHQLDLENWTSAELTEVPNRLYILDVQPAPDGRIAVLVQSQVAWDQAAALYLAYYEPETQSWSEQPHVLVDDPALQMERAHIVFDSEDGDALVAFVTSPYNANWPRTGELHHYDAQLQSWSETYSYTGFIWEMKVRELDPGEFVMFPDISEGSEGSYFFSEDLGLSEQTEVRFPDDYVNGTMYRAWFAWPNGSTLNHHEYTQEDPIGTTDSIDLFVGGQPVDYFDSGTELRVVNGQTYAMWVRTEDDHYWVEFAIHNEGGWSEAVAFGDHTHYMGTKDLVVTPEGHVAAAWSPGGCGGGACNNDPALLAFYDATADCWIGPTTLEVGRYAPQQIVFPSSQTAVVSTVGDALGNFAEW